MRNPRSFFSLLLVLLLALSLTLAACGGEDAAPAEQSPAAEAPADEAPADQPAAPAEVTDIAIATANMGAGFYVWGNAFAEMWNEHLPEWVSASAQATAGSDANIGLLQSGEVNMAICNNTGIYPSYRGTGKFAGAKFEDLRILARIYYTVATPVTRAETGITTYEGLAGSKFAVGAAGSGFEAMAREACAAYGMTYEGDKDLTAVYIGYTEIPDQMKNKFIDGGWISGPVPQSTLTELATSMELNYLTVDAEKQAAWAAEFPWWAPTVVPANTYPGQTEDITTMGVGCYVCVRADMDDELAYQLTKALFDFRSEMFHVSNLENYFTLDEAADAIVAPLHSGAQRYYEEQGLTIPDIPE